MNVYTMRSALAEVYSGDSWKEKVKKMTDEQVLAVYKRLERAGQLFKHNRRTLHSDKPLEAEYVIKDAQGRTVYISRGN